MSPAFRRLTLVVCLAAGPALADQGPAVMVADLEPTLVPAGGLEPYGFTELGGYSYYGAWDVEHGYELWRTDGTEAGTQLVIDLQPGPLGSLPLEFTVLGSELYFTANQGNGFGVWKTDGTAAGTVLVKGADLPAGFCKPRRMAAFGSGLMLVAGRPSEPALWVSDGTEAGTTRLRALLEAGEAGAGGDDRLPIAVAGGQAFVTTRSTLAPDAVHDSIWRSDGTTAGTRRVWSGRAQRSAPNYLTAGGRLYFDGGDGFWVTDGSSVGTLRLGGSGDLDVHWLTEHAGQIYLGEGAGGVLATKWALALWRTDGTVAGTQQVPVSFEFDQLTSIGTKLLVVAKTGSYGHERCQLQAGDGTPAGFVPLGDSLPCEFGYWDRAGAVAAVPGGALYLLNSYPPTTLTLGFTDGTPAGTRVLRLGRTRFEAPPDFAASRWRGPRGPLAGSLGQRAFFRGAGVDGVTSSLMAHLGLWASDGTPQGTGRVLAGPRTWESRPAGLVAHGQDALLAFSRYSSGSNSWAQALVVGSLDPASGQVRDLAEIADSFMGTACFRLGSWDQSKVGQVALLGDRADVIISCTREVGSFGSDVWALGKLGGTEPPRVLDTANGPGATVNGRLVYQSTSMSSGHFGLRARDGARGAMHFGLRAHDGGRGAPEILAQLDCDIQCAAPLFQAVGGRLFVATSDSRLDNRLFVTDGTPGGTSQVASLPVEDMEAFQGLLYFASGGTLWRSDGTASGTVSVATGLDLPTGLRAAGTRLYFSAGDATHGEELWVSDGTAAGTRRVADLRPGAEGSRPDGLAALGERVSFVADDGVSGRELWVSDGTASGTYRVSDIWTGPASGLASGTQLVSDGERVFFPAYRPESGIELWVSDGTESGTRMLQDIAPGAASSNPEELTVLGGRLYFSADDEVHGRELWTLPSSGPWVTVSEPEVVEGDAGVSFMEFELRLHSALPQAATVSWQTLPGGTAQVGEDYGALAGTATFAAGETLKTARVPVFGDRRQERTETVRIEVSPGVGLPLEATGRIVDDDTLAVGPRDAAVHERPGAVAVARVVLDRRPEAAPGAGTWSYATRDGVAQAGSDYVASSGLVPGTGPIEVGVLPDTLREGPESFWVDVTSAGGDTETARVTILDAWSRGDFDGDGQSDLLLREETSGTLQVWAMNGTTRTGVLSTTPSGLSDLQWRVAGTNDFDANGQADIVWRNEGSGKVVVWLMNGVERVTGSFTTPSGVVDTTWTVRATGDVDGDGGADVLWQQGQTGRLVVWLMNGLVRREGRFLVPEGPESAQWQAVGLADLTGDGRADLVLQHAGSGRMAVWELESGVRRRGAVLLPELADPARHVVAVGDWNGDGSADLLRWKEADGELEALLMSGLSLLERRPLEPATLLFGWRVAGPR